MPALFDLYLGWLCLSSTVFQMASCPIRASLAGEAMSPALQSRFPSPCGGTLKQQPEQKEALHSQEGQRMPVGDAHWSYYWLSSGNKPVPVLISVL